MTNNQKLILLSIIILGIGFLLFLVYRPDTDDEKSALKYYSSYSFTNISEFFPTEERNQIVQYTNLNIAYSEVHEQAIWVCYLLTKNNLQNPICKRNNYFKSDPNIYSQSATSKDYYKSGYDRGHLAPAADMLWSEKAMQESFYMSNISPQKKGFNRGVWKKLEGRVRKLALHEDSLIIITGPILSDTLGSIGESKVSIPAKYYKIIIDISAPHIGAIAFIMPNRNTKLNLDKFAVSIDSVEMLTGLDFLVALPNDLEEQLETSLDDYLLNILTQ